MSVLELYPTWLQIYEAKSTGVTWIGQLLVVLRLFKLKVTRLVLCFVLYSSRHVSRKLTLHQVIFRDTCCDKRDMRKDIVNDIVRISLML